MFNTKDEYCLYTALQPIYLSGNIPIIQIPADETTVLSLEIERGGTLISTITESYDPLRNEVIEINIRELLNTMLYADMDGKTFTPDHPYYIQYSSYGKVTIKQGETTLCSFYVTKGSIDVDKFLEATTFFKKNFLTSMPQTRYVAATEENLLAFFATEPVKIMIHGYEDFDDIGTLLEYQVLTSAINNKQFIFSARWELLVAKFVALQFGIVIKTIDIYILGTTSGVKSYPMRIMLKSEYVPQLDIFAFENSMGGIDTLRFTGEKTELPKHEAQTFTVRNVTREYASKPLLVFEKNTGWIESEDDRMWILDFFASHNRYHLHDNIFQSIVLAEFSAPSLPNSLNNFDFQFYYSRQKQGRLPVRLDTIL